MQGQRSDPGSAVDHDALSMLGKVHPTKSMGLDPLFGGDYRTLNPSLARGHQGALIGMSEEDITDDDLDPTWTRPLNMSFAEIAVYGLATGYACGVGVTAFKLLGNAACALLGVAYVPLASPKATDKPVYPTPAQLYTYAKWKLQQKFGWNWWYKASRGGYSAHIPMTAAVKKAIEKDQEKLGRRLFEYYSRDQKALAEARKNVPTASTYTLPMKWLPFKLKTDFENWFNNHPMKRHADVLRVQEELNPEARLSLAQRWTIFATNFQGERDALKLARKKLLKSYIQKNINQFKYQGPWWFLWMYLYGATIPRIYEAMPYRIVNRGTVLLGLILLATHTNLWFFGRIRSFKPEIRGTFGQKAMALLCLCGLAQVFNRAVEAMEGTAHEKTEGSEEIMRARMEKWIEEAKGQKSVTLWDAIQEIGKTNYEALQPKTPAPEVTRYKSSDHVRKGKVFPGEGWDPYEVTVRDGGKLRTLNIKSREFIKFGMYRPLYGSYLEWETIEKRWNEEAEKMRNEQTTKTEE